MAAVAVTLLTVAPSYAFQFLGYSSGMTIVEAWVVALKSGQLVHKEVVPAATFYIVGSLTSNTNTTLFFCDGHLDGIAASDAEDGGDKFASKVAGFIAAYGAPTVTASSAPGQGGLQSQVQMLWTIGPNTVLREILGLSPDLDHPGSKARIETAVTTYATTPDCPPDKVD